MNATGIAHPPLGSPGDRSWVGGRETGMGSGRVPGYDPYGLAGPVGRAPAASRQPSVWSGRVCDPPQGRASQQRRGE